jgi:hypothetical protein
VANTGTLSIRDSTVTANRVAFTPEGVCPAQGQPGGGGLYNAGALTLSNVTVSGNTAPSRGGGLLNDSGASGATLTHVTLAANGAAGGLDSKAPLTLRASVLDASS